MLSFYLMCCETELVWAFLCELVIGQIGQIFLESKMKEHHKYNFTNFSPFAPLKSMLLSLKYEWIYAHHVLSLITSGYNFVLWTQWQFQRTSPEGFKAWPWGIRFEYGNCFPFEGLIKWACIQHSMPMKYLMSVNECAY